MKIKAQTTMIAGLLATIVFSGATLMAGFMGLPKMSPPMMLSQMLGIPLFAGWLMHFMIGIVFSFGYVYGFNKLLVWVKSTTSKGILFGVFAFVFAQMMMLIMGMVFPMPSMQGSMSLMLIESLMGHIIFGLAVVWLIRALQSEPATSTV